MSFRDKIRMKNSWYVWHKDFISFFCISIGLCCLLLSDCGKNEILKYQNKTPILM